MSKLKFLSQDIMDSLQAQITANRDRYESGDFLDLELGNGWAIEAASVSIDGTALAGLDISSTKPEVEVQNSLKVFEALPGMTPAIAREGRVWTRLTHVEGLAYSRARWLSGVSGGAIDKAVLDHFFGTGLTSVRDDNAIGRLWWNARVAKIAAGSEDLEQTLALILKRADIRLNFVERSRTTSRPRLAQGMIRIMIAEPWITSEEANFRHFMKVLNRNGGGMLFEVMSETGVDKFLAATAAMAMQQAEQDLKAA
ncbi:DUF6339 family protein [Blastomonas fulva]|uniref:DUF6339 family protein n=1 Tax=Blastomonas fulva TaxID=1550728 RepID=UPI003F71B5B9